MDMQNPLPELRTMIDKLTHYNTQASDPQHSRDLFDSIRNQTIEWETGYRAHRNLFVHEFGPDQARLMEQLFEIMKQQLERKYHLLDNLPKKP